MLTFLLLFLVFGTQHAVPLVAAQDEPIDRRTGKLVELDAEKMLLTVELNDGFKLPVEITPSTKLTCARLPVPVKDLRTGMTVEVFFRGEQKVPFEVQTSWPRVEVKLTKVDAAKRQVTLPLGSEKGIDAEVVLPVRPDVLITLDELPMSLDDVPLNRDVSLELAADKKTVAGIRFSGEAGDVPVIIKSLTPGNKGLIVMLQAGNEKVDRQVEIGFSLADSVKVRILGKDAALVDLKLDMPATLRLAMDRQTITHIWAGAQAPKTNDDD
jgi:hypothetical protein